MSLLLRAKKYSDIARDQEGVFSIGQALAAGLTPQFLHDQVKANVLSRIGRGVYCVNGSPETFERRVWAACLESDGVASHRTAARLWRLDGVGDEAPETLDVVVPVDCFRKAAGAHVHRSRTLATNHVYRREGPPRTNIARTLIDLSEVLVEDDFELAFDSALRRVRVLRPWMKTMLKGISTRGHLNIGRLLTLVESTEPPLDSWFEVRLRQLLRRSGIPTPVCQYPVRYQSRLIARLDFAWPNLSRPVALLAHGYRWHGSRRRWKYDLWQLGMLNQLGWCVIPCAVDVLEQPAELLETLRAVCVLAGTELRGRKATPGNSLHAVR